MSIIAGFGLCPKSIYENYVNLIVGGQLEEAQSLINKITGELENSVSQLEIAKCSGEVFIALFEYFNTALGVDVRENMDLEELGENWRETTSDFDMIAFFEKERIKFSSLADTINYEEVSQFVNDFFENDYEDAGQIACRVFLHNLEKINTDTVLIFHLY